MEKSSVESRVTKFGKKTLLHSNLHFASDVDTLAAG